MLTINTPCDSFREVVSQLNIELGVQLADKIEKTNDTLFLIDIGTMQVQYNEVLEDMPPDAQKYAFSLVLAYFKIINDFVKNNADGIAANNEATLQDFYNLLNGIEQIADTNEYAKIVKKFDYGKDVFEKILKDATNYYCVNYKVIKEARQ